MRPALERKQFVAIRNIFPESCWSQYWDIVEANCDRAPEDRETTRRQRCNPSCRGFAGASCRRVVRNCPRLGSVEQRSHAAELYSSAGVPASFTSRGLRRIASKRTLRPVLSAPGERMPRNVTPMPVAPGERSIPRAESHEMHMRARSFEISAAARNRIVELFGADPILTGRPSPSRAISVYPVDARSVVAAVQSLFAGQSNCKAEWTIAGLAAIELRSSIPS